ncbi:hypothetical protein CO180_03080 [candidate division WWE3 bacterium CG_4_9_14_3_um_filter_41_6]|uniref:Uncharacterized protein n=1 Tax=candidate division WWE3 bacterium CG_4_10_14_0_2_um_filter_41_14 TaxID=1975072 RepID=A0A2M7TG63_UNCKA|nr:MAG: hypothetical protein COY32_05790 [candidate division WWE3 bacterium CG_4_10_14_0_2_um_filter_41_14]PJA38633.1 MAG: hypothetical protein CO180_03080 [candidate division WWE3 bacterium CG_4_9_14_3_um_filter_41_6]
MKISAHNVKLILCGVVGAIIIKLTPQLFSPEEFARMFYPNGGLIHEAVGAILVSFILLIAFLFLKNIRLKELVIISLTASILVSVIDSSRQLYALGFTHAFDSDFFLFETLINRFPKNLPYVLLYFFFGTMYYFLLVSLPFLMISGIKQLFLQLQPSRPHQK